MGFGQGGSRHDPGDTREDDGADESGLDSLLREVARLPDAAPPEPDRDGQPLVGIIGKRLAGRFVVRRRIGQGGMGVVFEAFDELRGEIIALKTLERLDGLAIHRMKNEFRALVDLVHPNLVRLHELFSNGERWFFTMARVDGVSFLEYARPRAGGRRVDPFGATEDEARVESEHFDAIEGTSVATMGPLRERALRVALAGLAAGVRAIHRAGKLHRDLKPSNVLVDPSGRVTILDFGLASPVKEDDRSRDLEFAGTPAYMAPEQLEGRASPASDWYAVGVMLHEALSGRQPFHGGAMEILGDKFLGRAPLPLHEVAPDAPIDLADLAMALLRADPEDRPREDEIVACVGAAPEVIEPAVVQAASFVGRAAELERLRRAFTAVRNGSPAVVYVMGASGLGKTALVERFLDEVRGEAEVLSGRCYEREAVPYKALDALVDALCRRLRALDATAAARLTPRSTTELCRLFPVLERVPAFVDAMGASAASDPEEVRLRAFLALKETFARLGNARPVVLFIDDLQWGDVDSTVFLRELAAPPAPLRVLLIGAYRSDEIERSPLLRILRDDARRARGQHIETLALEPLDEAAANKLAGALLGPSVNAERARAVAAEARGNPFFLTQLARASAGAFASGTTLAELVSTTVRALPVDAQSLLEVVAIASGPVRRDVALGAAGLAPMHDEVVPLLVRAALLRSSGPLPGDALETYHDRIRELVTAALPAERVRVHHRALAETLGDVVEPAAALLAFHWREAGERVPARVWSIRAASIAERALAFDRAAELYEQAIGLSTGDEDAAERRDLDRRLGEALASAGRGMEAACVFQRAAEGAPDAESIELNHRATYELLHAGDLEQGMAAARPLLRHAGVWLPRSSLVMGVLLLASLRYWRWRGFLSPVRTGTSHDPRLLRRIDLAASILTPMGMIDVMTSAYLGMRALWWARSAGEPVRLGAFAMVMYATLAAFEPQRSSRQLAAIRRHGDAYPGPHTQASFMYCEAFIAYTAGDLRLAALASSDAERFYERLPAASAQLSFARAYRVWSLCWLGEMRQVASLVPALKRSARERGNWWMQCAMRGFPAVFVHLVADHGDLAAREVTEALSVWSATAPILQSGYVLARGAVDLYLGRAADLRSWLQRTWPGLRRSGALSVAMNAAQLIDVRCRTTLAAASSEHDPSAAKTLARAADRDARKLGSLRVAIASPLAALARAGAAHLLGTLELRAPLLEEAIRGFDAIGMQLHAACARRRLGALRGGSEGERLIAEGDRFMREQTIARPDRFTAMLAPGFPD